MTEPEKELESTGESRELAGLEVVYEDPHCLIVSKPPGLLTQGRLGGEPALEDQVREYLTGGDPSKSTYLGTVHRLDRPVSGLVLWAKTEKSARRLADQFAARTIRKSYAAVVESAKVVHPTGLWTDWLGPVLDGKATCGTEQQPNSKQAITEYKVDLHINNYYKLILEPKTGRTHQLRAQAAAHLGPIVGDVAYGSSRPWPRGIALHAYRLEFLHPTLKERVILEAPLPSWWPELRDLADRPQS